MQLEIEEKLRRVRETLRRHSLDAVYLRRQSNFSWITAGGCNQIGITTEMGTAGVLVTAERGYTVCNNVEAPRMEAEEQLPDKGFEVRSFPWHTDREAELVAELSGGGRVAADFALPGATSMVEEIAALRYALTPWEIERYRRLAETATNVLEEVAAGIKPGDRECEVVGRMSRALWDHRIDIVINFCAADERCERFRHPTVTERAIERRAMIGVNARKGGLIVCLTRFVQFGPVPEALAKQYRDNVEIDCVIMNNTRPGLLAAKALEAGIETYRRLGYEAEWEKHHQGGSIGYRGRDYKVTSSSRQVVQENQGFCWNPSISGTKSEDTMLATATGPDIITAPVRFPVLEMSVEGRVFRRPGILSL